MRKKTSHQKNSGKNKKAQIRIIGGQWRGRKLPVADVEGLRPTGDRIRETLFNWLQGDIQGTRCLDLFAGTGALGLEALSRYAGEVVFIEKNKIATETLQNSLDLLSANNATLSNGDALQWLQQQGDTLPFDIIFLDPPFALDLWQRCLQIIKQNRLLTDGGLIYIESPQQQNLAPDHGFDQLKEKAGGNIRYGLYQYCGR